jgi:ABC-2 type transport system ATP-binding protein
MRTDGRLEDDMPAVVTRELGKTYSGNVPALTDLNLSIEEGEVFGLLGPNGAGKTTTVRLLNGTLEPTVGTAHIFGLPAVDVETKHKTATLAEAARMYEHLSAVKNLEFFAAMYGMSGSSVNSRIHELLERMGLKDRENDRIGTYSTGMKKRVQLARVLLHDPSLIFLDEPTAGLDPDAARQVTGLIRTLSKDDGTTVILCTHNLAMAESVCDTFGFLSDGMLVALGRKETLIAGTADRIAVDVVTRDGTESIDIESEDEINGHLLRIIKSGQSIREVRLHSPNLESLYFEYVGRSKHELG